MCCGMYETPAGTGCSLGVVRRRRRKTGLAGPKAEVIRQPCGFHNSSGAGLQGISINILCLRYCMLVRKHREASIKSQIQTLLLHKLAFCVLILV